jgi:hypothetical protein
MEQRVDIQEVETFVSAAKADAAELRQSTHSLPPVNQDGSSPCPWAEPLYAKHDELRNKLQSHLHQAREYLTAVESETTKCSHDLAVITVHEDRLHRDQPRAHFSEAEARVAALYKRYQHLQAQLKELITYLDKVIQEAAPWQFPGGLPRKWPDLGTAPVRPKPGDGDTGAPSEQELDALFEMDRRAQEKR